MARMKPWPDSISSAPSAPASIFVNSLMSAPAENVKMFDEAIHQRPQLALDLVPQPLQLADHLRRERVGGRAVEPGDAHVAARLEQHRLAVLAAVGLRVGEEALTGLLAEPALARPGAEEQRRREVLAPFRLGPLERREHVVEARSSARANGRGRMPAPAIIPISVSLVVATPSSTTRQASTSAFSEKRSTSVAVTSWCPC